jgi:hypothetical protein
VVIIAVDTVQAEFPGVTATFIASNFIFSARINIRIIIKQNGAYSSGAQIFEDGGGTRGAARMKQKFHYIKRCL